MFCRAIARACQNLLQPDKRTSDAVDVRMELDLRIGIVLSRFFSSTWSENVSITY